MGKSALTTTIADNVAATGVPVGFYSLEMSREQVATRIICGRAGVSVERAMHGRFNDEELRRFGVAAAIVSGLPITIDETGAVSIAQLAARARRLKRKQAIGLLIVDYLQLMVGTSRRGDSRVQEVTEITTGLKALAKELRVPVLALSQLSRKVEDRQDKRPQLADLRESGSIEQDADLVMFIYRDEYYDKETEREGIADVIISKHRNGGLGDVELTFQKEYPRFMSYVGDDRY